jgi:hypothetical protein
VNNVRMELPQRFFEAYQRNSRRLVVQRAEAMADDKLFTSGTHGAG